MTTKLLTVNEVASLLGLKPARIYELSREGKLPFLVKLGWRQYRYSALGLERFIEAGGNQDQQDKEVKD